ncbi:MAG: 4-hydroxybenzoyl-CoA reductase subunit alpha [Alphaproteobacteria bacterium]|nr:4-hydroxybenzoyl-CoA reductase subunit alpha [Alphaproteobacteria bacterium]
MTEVTKESDRREYWEAPAKTIGQRLPLVDGPEKTTGRAEYSADLPAPDALVGRILHSPVSHADIVAVETAAAAALPGVVAVITGEDCDQTHGILPIAMTEYPLARERVRYRGEPVAAVAAVDDETAVRALELIEFRYEELPAYYTAAEARAAEAVQLHEKRKGNLERHVEFELGDTAAGFAAAERVCELSFDAAEVNHAQMEPNAALADWDPERQRLDLQTSTQVPFYVHLMVARCLQVDKSQVRVVKPYVGGGFGARTETLFHELICSLLARAACGRVRIVTQREANFICHRGRPETQTRMKIGLAKDGLITAVQCEAVQRGGAYASYGTVTILYAGSLLYGLYNLPAVKYDGFRVLTNTPPCGAMRGHGTVNVRFAFEAHLDAMAAELGLDPFAVRRANLLKAPTFTENDLMVKSYGLPECLDWVEEASAWKDRKGTLPPGRGLGMACSHYVSGASKPVHWTGEPHAVVNLKLDFDGAIVLLTGAAEIGQGSSTVLAQCVAEVMGLDLSRIRVVASDSRVTPKDNGSYSSRVTFMVGNAAIEAAENLKGVLIEAAAKKLDAQPKDVECLGEVYRAASQDRGIDYEDVVAAALEDSGTITAKGTFSTIPESHGGKKYRGAAIGGTMGFSYAAQVVEVSVDPDTAFVKIEKVWVAHDCGYALNPLTVEGQVQGSVWMGMGQAMSEETRFHNGMPIAANMLDYRIPTIVESPDIEVKIVESIDPHGPFGAKEAGEGSLSGFPGAVAAAIADAMGVRVTELPITPDRLMAAIEAYEKEQRAGAA